MSENEFNWKLMDKNYRKIAQLYLIYKVEFNEELFKKQLVDDFPINYRVPQITSSDKWFFNKTLFQLVGLSNDKRQFLIDHGADYTVTDREGSTVLHKSASSEFGKYLTRFEFHQLQEDELLVNFVLSAHIKSGNFNNPKDQNGLTYFHVACMYNHENAVNFFLKNGVSFNELVNKDSTFCPGYSALHFAVKMCALETVQLLLKAGADMFVEDVSGRNPLHLLIIERIKIFIKLKRLKRVTLSENVLWHHSKLQECYSKNQEMIIVCLGRINQCRPNFFNNTVFSLIHLIFTADNMQIKQFIDRNEENFVQLVNTGPLVLSGYTPVHFAALFSVDALVLLIEKGATLDTETKDANKVTPFDMCLRGFNAVDMHRILMLQPDYSRIVFSDRKTKLSDFIYAMRETATFEIFLQNHLTNVNMFIPFDSPVCAGYTSLHFAVICTEQPINWSWKSHYSKYDIHFEKLESEESEKYLSRIDLCLRYNAEVTCRDAQGSTPLHWAFRLQESHAVHRLLQQLKTNSNFIDQDGLSHLHIACAAEDDDLIGELVCGGADVNQIATSAYTWIDVQSAKSIDDKRCFINKGSTPLHFATSVQCLKVVEILTNHGADVLAKDDRGLNPLESMLDMPIFDDKEVHKKTEIYGCNVKMQIARLLVRKISNKLVDTQPDQMMHCFSLLDDESMIEICQYNEESLMRIFENWDITGLHVACFIRDSLRVIELAAEIDVNARVSLKSPLWPGCTPLHLFTKFHFRGGFDAGPENMAIATILLELGADVAARDGNGETPIHQMFEYYCYHVDWHFGGEPHYSIRYLELLLAYLKDFDVNPSDRQGFTHLHIASLLGKVSVVEKLLEQGAEIDQPADYFKKNYGGFTALHFAVLNHQNNMVDFLLKHGADINWRNTYDGIALHVANRQYRPGPCLDLLQTLVSAGADINAKNMHEETPFESLVKSRHVAKEEIEFFLDNGCRVNTVNPLSGEGFLAKALNNRRWVPMFEIILDASDIKDIDDNGRNAIHTIVDFHQPCWEFLDGDEEIDNEYTPPTEYTRTIGSLIKLGLNIDQQDCHGMTPLHVATKKQNLTGIIGLLENGADINITDADRKSAFDYSLELADHFEEPSELDLRILKIISIQILKLKFAGIGVSETNRNIDEEIREDYNFEEPVTAEEYNDEAEKMLEEQIPSTSITFYQFLSDTWAVSAFPYIQPTDREAVVKYFENEVENLRIKFPGFAGVLLLQYRKALARSDIVESASIPLDFLLGFPMPAVCSRYIFEHLSNDDLNSLISSTAILNGQ